MLCIFIQRILLDQQAVAFMPQIYHSSLNVMCLTVNVTTRLANTGQLAKSGKQNIRKQHFSVHLPQGPWTVPLERNPYKFTICDLFLAIGTLIKKVTYGNGFTTN